MTDQSATVTASDGRKLLVPDPDVIERAVDATLMRWPPGNFDSTTDLIAAPSKNPTSFTNGNFPYSHSGPFMAGPFKGLSVQNNNVHGLNSDATSEADAAPLRFAIDKELFLAILLQRSSNAKYRWDPKSGKKPSEILLKNDPTPGHPSMNHVVALPTYPKTTLAEPTSLWNSDPGLPVWHKINAMSAWQNTIIPPPPPRNLAIDAATRQLGRQTFEQAGCAKCHSGPMMTNNRVIAQPEIGTQPVRARGMSNTFASYDPNAIGYAFDQKVPLPDKPRTIEFSTRELDPEQIKLAYGWPPTSGGYKVPALVGLWWSAPYLHDGGVAVGVGRDKQLGLPGTLLSRTLPDPPNSLRALIDRDLRRRVVDANHADEDLRKMNVEGIGHAFWVDAVGGFTSQQQEALILYLLTYRPPPRLP